MLSTNWTKKNPITTCLKGLYWDIYNLVGSCSSDLIQDLPVTSQELRQVFDELLDALQSSLLHDGARLLGYRLWDRVSGQILQRCWQV